MERFGVDPTRILVRFIPTRILVKLIPAKIFVRFEPAMIFVRFDPTRILAGFKVDWTKILVGNHWSLLPIEAGVPLHHDIAHFNMGQLLGLGRRRRRRRVADHLFVGVVVRLFMEVIVQAIVVDFDARLRLRWRLGQVHQRFHWRSADLRLGNGILIHLPGP